MARRAPAVERSVAILNLLAEDPDRRWTLSEIARDLRLNKATLHAILFALNEAGYLTRDAGEKTYGLGPALIALGNSALAASPAAHTALPEMQALTDELGVECVASAAIHDEIVILVRAGTPRPFGVFVEPGQRLPLAPPLGSVFVAWSDDDTVLRWLRRAAVPKVVQKRYREAIDVVRQRGYSVGLEGERFARALGGRPRDARSMLERNVRGIRIEEYALLDLDPEASYRVNHIGAPVFGPDEQVALALFLIGFAGQLPGAAVEAIAARLLEVAGRISLAIRGRSPQQVRA
jgi:DNA-binding IclR family transcriptional regulator